MIGPAPRWPLFLAAAAALAWAALAVALVIGWRTSATVVASPLFVAGGILLVLAAPVAVIVLVAMLLRDTGAMRAERTALLADAAWLADHRLDEAGTLLANFEFRFAALADQMATIAAVVAAQDQRLAANLGSLGASAAMLIDATGAASAAGDRLDALLPAVSAQARALQSLLANTDADLQRQIADTETLLAGLWTRASDVTAEGLAAADAAARRIDAITAAAAAAGAALGAPIAALDQASQTASDRAAASVAATNDAIAAQSDRLARIGDDAAKRAEKHLARLNAAASQLTGEMDHQAERYRIFIEQLERGFAKLDARLVESVAISKAELDTVAAGMMAAREAIEALAPPIEMARHGLVAITGHAESAGATTATTIAAIDTALPAASASLAAMASGLAALHSSAGALASPIDTGTAAIGEAASALADAQARLESAARRASYELAAARDVITEIETQAGSTALAAASQLVDVFGRVRDVANQTAGTMRATLGGVVAEAEAALVDAGSARAETAFGAPIRTALADLAAANTRTADAAQAAVDRITQRLLALTGTIATVESRLAEAEDAQASRLRDDIASRSATLLASLDAAAIDITTLLASDVDEAAWRRWLDGERGLFLRRAVRLVDARTARAIAGQMQGDAAFREAATRFIGEFEALIARVLPDREGRNLALALLSSDPGKLYIALSQGSDRLQ